MRAAFIHNFGGINGIEMEELPKPVPAEDEMLIEVHYKVFQNLK